MYTKTLFISHSWRYSEPYEAMIRLLTVRPYFSFKNCSVPESKAFVGLNKAGLQQQLRYQIGPSQCVIIIGGMWFNHSEWIQYEMNVALQMRKPLLCVRPRSARVLPLSVTAAAEKVVNWNTDSIVAGIREIC